MIAAPVISIRPTKVRLNRRVHLREIENVRAREVARQRKRRKQEKKRRSRFVA